MPALVRKLLVFAAVEGLVLQPVNPRSQPAVCIEYSANRIRSIQAPVEKSQEAIDCYGIVGRKEVAQIRSVPVYVITSVALIPLESRQVARNAILEAKRSQQHGTKEETDAAVESEDSEDESHLEADNHNQARHDIAHGPNEHSPGETSGTGSTASRETDGGIAHDVIGRRGYYGSLAERWFSKRGWSNERRKAQGMSSVEELSPHIDHSAGGSSTVTSAKEASASESTIQGKTTSEDPLSTLVRPLVPKFLRTTKLLLSSRSFFFSYDLNITRQLSARPSLNLDIPLAKLVDPVFFWNHALIAPFLEPSNIHLAMPIMQGFVGQRAFFLAKDAPSHLSPSDAPQRSPSDPSDSFTLSDAPSATKFWLTLISRRSIYRPGLRYLRRGVDEDGNCANFVETEQYMTTHSNVGDIFEHSFLQIRGSVPLFFSQSPYSFKPVPSIQYSEDTNTDALVKHFQKLHRRYGDIQVVSLVDKQGPECAIGQKYQDQVHASNERGSFGSRSPKFEWFDFHQACRGMKFENVSALIDSIGKTIDQFEVTQIEHGSIKSQQKGVPRVNCMDCLDRTNVVQSAIAQYVLERHLFRDGYRLDLKTDVSTVWFNSLWADNGDAISKQYSSTAALKGDYTRTRQRNYRGAINDFGLTLTRYYNNIVNDYFAQTVIDYLFGNVDAQVFEDFEQNLMNRDPSISIKNVREQAINTSSKIVIENEEEEFISGWTLLSPHTANTIRSFPFEECVLLMTSSALYHVRFDWNAGKVSSFLRINLDHILGIVQGTYITSTLTPAAMDPDRNVGFIVRYRSSEATLERVNTRSLANARTVMDNAHNARSLMDAVGEGKSARCVLAFKMPPTRITQRINGQEASLPNEQLSVDRICDEIHRTVCQRQACSDRREDFIDREDIVSLQEAKKSTGLVEQWSYNLKRLIWS